MQINRLKKLTEGSIYNESKCNYVGINIREILKSYLKEKGMTASEFARLAGLEKQTVYNYLDERKDVSPNIRTLNAIFKCHPDFKEIYDRHSIQSTGASESEEIYSTSSEYDKAIQVLKKEIKEHQIAIEQKEKIIKLLKNSKMK